MSHLTSCTNGGKTVASRTFLMTSTVNGGLYHVRRWLAGSWMVLSKKKKKWNIIEINKNQPMKNVDSRRECLRRADYQVILWFELVSIFISRANDAACDFGESRGNTPDTTTQTLLIIKLFARLSLSRSTESLRWAGQNLFPSLTTPRNSKTKDRKNKREGGKRRVVPYNNFFSI